MPDGFRDRDTHVAHGEWYAGSGVGKLVCHTGDYAPRGHRGSGTLMFQGGGVRLADTGQRLLGGTDTLTFCARRPRALSRDQGTGMRRAMGGRGGSHRTSRVKRIAPERGRNPGLFGPLGAPGSLSGRRRRVGWVPTPTEPGRRSPAG